MTKDLDPDVRGELSLLKLAVSVLSVLSLLLWTQLYFFLSERVVTVQRVHADGHLCPGGGTLRINACDAMSSSGHVVYEFQIRGLPSSFAAEVAP